MLYFVKLEGKECHDGRLPSLQHSLGGRRLHWAVVDVNLLVVADRHNF